jgi:proton glutamate symport protein
MGGRGASRRWGPTTQVIIALAAGILLGIAISASENSSMLGFAESFESVGILWVNAIRMVVIPLIVSLLFVSVAGFSDVRSAGRMGLKAVLLFLVLLAGAAMLAMVTLPALFALMPEIPPRAAGLAEFARTPEGLTEAATLPSFGEWLTALIPTNPVRAAADDAILPVVIFSVLFGCASAGIASEHRDVLVRFFRALSEAMLALVQWLIVLAPLGVFALILPLAAKIGASAFGVFGYYVIVTCAVLIILILALYPVAIVFGRLPIRRFARAVFPAQTVAFSTRSSLASLPAMLKGADETLPGRKEVSGFVLPLAVSAFKVNAPVALVAGACFLSQLYGVPLGPKEYAVILVSSVLISFGGSGVPMGSLFLMAPVFAAVGLPVEGIGILIALDLLPDIFKTISAVTGDMAVAAILSRPDEMTKSRGVEGKVN